MIHFTEEGNNLILEYTSEYQSVSWIDKKLSNSGNHTFNNTFTVSKRDILTSSESDEGSGIRRFLIGRVEGDYQLINKEVLGLKYDLAISNTIKLSKKLFIATANISIFGRIDSLIDEPIVLGGDREDAIPQTEFTSLLKNFPTTTELKKYSDARIARDLKDYFGTMSDAEAKLVNYMGRSKNSRININKSEQPVRFANELELEKYLYLRNKLAEMLSDSSSYVEEKWQKVVANLFLLIFPQYIAVLEKVSLREVYSDPSKPTKREFDFALVDSNGCIDLIEIKRPFDDKMLAKSQYRDNYVPHGELSGAIMQAEKYLFYLSKAGKDIEDKIQLKYAKQIPAGIAIKVANPKAIILSGRDNNLSDRQKFDLGFIRKKYSNIVDIISYDDLLRRIDNIIAMLKVRSSV